jgi:alkanesulfonate monooxygenase SsuD/methylene tetrahydromethanopterin reductase-like flavin-dependent oxidoreductase (luciferase family)
MRIGLITQLHGSPKGDSQAPSWNSIRQLALSAEAVGFDMFVFEDALMYRGEETTDGCWESVVVAAAVAAATERINFGQSVMNSPYRSPAHTASIAATLDEVSGGRYVLGIGAGNTPDSDYEAFGFPTDRRYSRFAEAIEIIHGLLHDGAIDFAGDYYTARQAELVLRGPSPKGPRINIAAGGSKMLHLVARYADAWNWWGGGETMDEVHARVGPLLQQLEEACEAIERDPATLERTYDLYGVASSGSSAAEVADSILALGALGFTEVRCDLTDKTPAGVESMASVVELVHAG